jgi:hypothetical protein
MFYDFVKNKLKKNDVSLFPKIIDNLHNFNVFSARHYVTHR